MSDVLVVTEDDSAAPVILTNDPDTEVVVHEGYNPDELAAKADTTALNDAVQALTALIGEKAAQAAVDAIVEQVVDLQTSTTSLTDSISTLEGVVGAKAAQAALDALSDVVSGLQASDVGAIPTTAKGSAGGVAPLGADSLISSLYLPPVAITDTFPVNSQAEMLALTAERGDVAVRQDLHKSFVLRFEPASTLANWVELQTPTDSVLSVDGRVGAISLADRYFALSGGTLTGRVSLNTTDTVPLDVAPNGLVGDSARINLVSGRASFGYDGVRQTLAIAAGGSKTIAFHTNGNPGTSANERMRITDTGVAIGKTSNAYPLDVVGDAQVAGRIHGVTDPAVASDVATKQYADTKVNKGGDTLTGQLNFADVAHARISGAFTNKDIVKDETLLAQQPYAQLWHDLLAFNSGSYVQTFETSADAVTFSTATIDQRLFAMKENQSLQVINGSTVKACRWTWQSGNLAFAQAHWFAIGYAYNTLTGNKNVLVESSVDGITWTVRHTSTHAANGAPVWHYVTDWAGDTYVRLTITNAGTTNAINLSTIRLLTARWGDQGRGSEGQYPYQWDENRRISINGASFSYPFNVAGDAQITGRLRNMLDPALAQDAATKNYADVSDSIMKPLDVGQEILPRAQGMNGIDIANGQMILSYFTSRRSETVTKLVTALYSVAAVAPSLARLGLYSVAADGTHTLIASTANDTALWTGTTYTATTKSLTAGVALTRGNRYAVGFLIVGATTLPKLMGVDFGGNWPNSYSPSIAAQVTGLSDLPSSIASTSPPSAFNRLLQAFILP